MMLLQDLIDRLTLIAVEHGGQMVQVDVDSVVLETKPFDTGEFEQFKGKNGTTHRGRKWVKGKLKLS